MSDDLITKIIEDLAEIPKEIKFLVAPYKLSDPFLEPRLFDIMRFIRDRLSNARISLITNGSALTDHKIDQLAEFQNIAYLHVSLNETDPVRYHQTMALPLERTLKRLEALHERAMKHIFNFPIRVTRVGGANDENKEFIDFVKKKYPLFKPIVVNNNDWIGELVTTHSSTTVPDAPCQRWFDFSITSTGEVAQCCMDGEARYAKGNVRDRSILEIYNQPRLRQLRENLISRKAALDPCRRCTYR